MNYRPCPRRNTNLQFTSTICYNLENAYHYTRIQTERAGKEYCYARPASYFCPFKKCSDKGVE